MAPSLVGRQTGAPPPPPRTCACTPDDNRRDRQSHTRLPAEAAAREALHTNSVQAEEHAKHRQPQEEHNGGRESACLFASHLKGKGGVGQWAVGSMRVLV